MEEKLTKIVIPNVINLLFLNIDTYLFDTEYSGCWFERRHALEVSQQLLRVLANLVQTRDLRHLGEDLQNRGQQTTKLVRGAQVQGDLERKDRIRF